jgi:hypothetical protein
MKKKIENLINSVNITDLRELDKMVRFRFWRENVQHTNNTERQVTAGSKKD